MIKQSVYMNDLRSNLSLPNLTDYTKAWLSSAIETFGDLPVDFRNEIDDLSYEINRTREPLRKCKLNARLHVIFMILDKKLEMDVK